MKDNTISLAIDLGMTNAKMACCRSGSVVIIPNQEGEDHTPCVVWLTPRNEFVVGRRAQEALFTDPGNVGINFIRNLGADVDYTFVRSAHHLKPEDLAAQLLMALRSDAEQFTGQEISNVVVTVPLIADANYCAAVQRAALLAGFQDCQLLQNVVGAALASGVSPDASDKPVLIYDFGGNCFSASVLRLSEGQIHVVTHAGDSFLGGANLDSDIVESFFVPALQATQPELDLSAGNPRSREILAKLRAQAEVAKFRLDSVHETSGFIMDICQDLHNRQVDFKYKLTRSQLEIIAAPLVDYSIDTCKEVLSKAHLAPADVSNVITVGGMAAMPFVQQRLQDWFGQQSIPIVSADDPTTAIVRGAAIFAASRHSREMTGSATRPRFDKVHFAASSPPTALSGQTFIVDVWAHLERQRAEVERRIQRASPSIDVSPIIRPKGPFRIERGTTLIVRLKFQGLHVDPQEDAILWEGDIGNASFAVAVPSETAEGVKCGLVTVHWEGGLQIARLPIQILVAPKVAPTAPTTQPLHHIRKAFASYASADRDEVIGRIQGMQKIAPDLDVFLDVVNLRSGEDWEKRLWQVIPDSDVFYLFWSAAAKASPWVEKEWRCALNSRGEDFIDPVPLVSPDEVRPPDELSRKHFNDWILAFRRRSPRTD